LAFRKAYSEHIVALHSLFQRGISKENESKSGGSTEDLETLARPTEGIKVLPSLKYHVRLPLPISIFDELCSSMYAILSPHESILHCFIPYEPISITKCEFAGMSYEIAPNILLRIICQRIETAQILGEYCELSSGNSIFEAKLRWLAKNASKNFLSYLFSSSDCSQCFDRQIAVLEQNTLIVIFANKWLRENFSPRIREKTRIYRKIARGKSPDIEHFHPKNIDFVIRIALMAPNYDFVRKIAAGRPLSIDVLLHVPDITCYGYDTHLLGIYVTAFLVRRKDVMDDVTSIFDGHIRENAAAGILEVNPTILLARLLPNIPGTLLPVVRRVISECPSKALRDSLPSDNRCAVVSPDAMRNCSANINASLTPAAVAKITKEIYRRNCTEYFPLCDYLCLANEDPMVRQQQILYKIYFSLFRAHAIEIVCEGGNIHWKIKDTVVLDNLIRGIITAPPEASMLRDAFTILLNKKIRKLQSKILCRA
jgi:hypothetical protein